MSGYQPGDRLRITFEGVVSVDGTYVILRNDDGVPFGYHLPRLAELGATIERILPPLVVGQPVPLDRLGELPDGSVVAGLGRDPAIVRGTHGGRMWFRFGAAGSRTYRPDDATPILLRLGDGTPSPSHTPAPEPPDACGRGICALGAGHGGKCRT